ncbi:MAG: (2Fe-2S)-binding protein [Pseudomonadota bacterium]
MTVTVTIDGEKYQARESELLATLLLQRSIKPVRKHPIDGSPRTPFCMMGVCFECLVTVDGVTNQQACLTTVEDGMVVERDL